MNRNLGYGLALGALLFIFSACRKDDSASVSPQPPANQPPGTPPPTPGSLGFIIYADDLESGGGAFLYPGGDNQELSFSESSNPSTGSKCIRYSWNGGDTAGQHGFVGMDLMHVGLLSQYKSTPGIDLRSKTYQSVTFDARGALGTNVVVKIEVSDDGDTTTPAPCIVLSASGTDDDSSVGNPASCINLGQLQTSWQRFRLNLTPSDQVAVKDYFKATFIDKAGPLAPASTGGTVFFDQIIYQP